MICSVVCDILDALLNPHFVLVEFFFSHLQVLYLFTKLQHPRRCFLCVASWPCTSETLSNHVNTYSFTEQTHITSREQLSRQFLPGTKSEYLNVPICRIRV